MDLASIWEILHFILWFMVAVAVFLAAPFPSGFKKSIVDLFNFVYNKGLFHFFIVYFGLLVFLMYESYREIGEVRQHNAKATKHEEKEYLRLFRAERNLQLTSFSIVMIIVIYGYQKLLQEATKANLNLAVLKKQAEGQQAGMKVLEKEGNKISSSASSTTASLTSASTTSLSSTTTATTKGMTKDEVEEEIKRRANVQSEGVTMQYNNLKVSFEELLARNEVLEKRLKVLSGDGDGDAKKVK